MRKIPMVNDINTESKKESILNNNLLTVLTNSDNKLDLVNNLLHKKILQIRDRINNNTKENVDYLSYPIVSIWNQVFDAIKDVDNLISSSDDVNITFIDRNKFNSDICIKIPSLLEKYKPKTYITKYIPLIVEKLRNSSLAKDGVFEKIETVGIYINITLSDEYLLKTVGNVIEKWDNYWENNLNSWKIVLLDYSSPNAAKHLHAWHIRSTIIWEILSNLYRQNWYTTHRINHVNDRWGFWYLIEWYNRWKDKIPTYETKNDMLFFIYSMYRKGEKVAKNEDEYNALSSEDKEELAKYYWSFDSYNEFKKLFDDFVESWTKIFSSLESWGKEIEIWKKMVDWSMEDFNKFYDSLNIHLDYCIGESFYVNIWKNLINWLLKKWIVVLYTDDLANKDISILEEKLNNNEITQDIFDREKAAILKDAGSYVIPLDGLWRFVVMKLDGSSIYATRDLWAVAYRVLNFSPNKIVYEVWQEQEDHFSKLFASAQKMGITGVEFEHVDHGFYIDADSGKKLSSRDWASNIQNLIKETIKYFKGKYVNCELSEAEINKISEQLAIWSIIINDIKADRKVAVKIDNNIETACKWFEESWWAYLLYTVVRANSILKKIWDREIKDTGEPLNKIERILINEINRFPLVIREALEKNNPSVLVEFLVSFSQYYNNYYNSNKVLQDDFAIKSKVDITRAVVTVLTNWLRICNVSIPDKM